MLFPHLYETFCSVGLEHDDTSPNRIVGLEDFVALSINSINEENVKVEDIRALVRPHPSRYKLNNWSATNDRIVSHFHSNAKH